MTFRKFIQLLADNIGLHQIPVIYGATEIRHFLAEDAVHHQLVTMLVKDIYKRNNCGHLDAAIDSTKTLQLLGTARATLLAGDDLDVCKFRFINQLCEYSYEILSSSSQLLGPERLAADRPELSN